MVFKLDQPLTREIMASLVKSSFKENEIFSKAGILYAESNFLIVTGPYGSNQFQIKCKIKDCENNIDDFERLIQNLA